MAIRPTQDNKEEFVQLPAGVIPANLNPEFWIARTNDILGGPKIFNTLEEFVQLHPNLMEIGMEVTINQHLRDNGLFPKTRLSLTSIPSVDALPLSISPNQLDINGNEVLDGGGLPIPNTNFYGSFYETAQVFEQTGIETVYEYAPDINGLKPIFPYIVGQEGSWSATYNPATSKWLRSRNTDRTDPNTGIYLDWSIPLPINGNFETGDFLANLFIRSVTAPALPKALKKDGTPNNEPEGWTDIPTVGTDPLYEIRGQKDKYGNLKSAWIGPFLIPEDEDLIRYNSQTTPNPNTIVNQTTVATDGSQADTDLIAAGWVKLFDPTIHKFRASRIENAPSDYTQWDLVKIADESGEYIDRIYKLFPINTDFDSLTFVQNNTPTGNDPIANTQVVTRNEGWSDTPLSETDTTINSFSQARKFIDGSLKTPWSSPLPFTGKSTYIDYIRSNGENTFKYASSTDNTPDPATITLEAFLFKGNSEITTGLTYKWFKIYNNKAAIAVDPVNDTPLATTKTLVVSPAAVATKAIFRCYTTLAISGGTDIEFIEEESIVDITDGDDAKNLTLSSETPIVLYDTSGAAFSVDNIRLRAFQNFLDGVTFYWYKDDGAGNWVALTNGVGGYTLTNQSLLIATATLFTADGTKENARYAISTANLPANVEGVNEFYDVFTVAKLSSAGVGAAGQDAYTVVLSNEVDNLTLDRATGLPQAGEMGSVGTVSTLVSLFDGTTKLTAGTDYTVTVTSTESPNIEFIASDEGIDYKVYIDDTTWNTNGVRKVTGIITIDIVGVTEDIVKNFTVSTSLDDAGALIPFIQVAGDSLNKGFSFVPSERRDIKLEAVLDQNGTKITSDNFDGNVVWLFNNVNSGVTNTSGTNDLFKEIRRIDVVNNLSISAQIVYNGNTYTTTPVTIDDITDSQQYILYHNYATVPAEPLAAPTKPVNTPVADFETNFALSPAGALGYFREPGLNSYWYTLGQVENIGGVDTIVFPIPIRNRGEKGDQGPTPDFIVTYYKANNTGTLETVPQSNASRQQMLDNGWFQASALTTGQFLYEASTTFNGTDVNNLNALATNNWKVIGKTIVDGVDGDKGDKTEFRYQGTTEQTPLTFNNTNRNAGVAWNTSIPDILSNNYIYVTTALIDGEDDTLIGTWSAPVVFSVSPNIITEQVSDNTSRQSQYLFENK